MKLLNLLGVFAATLVMALAPAAHATVTTSSATVLGLRVHPAQSTDAFVRIEVDKDLNCGVRVVGAERKRAYIFAAGASGNSPAGTPTTDDISRVQSVITAAMLSGKKVTLTVDETATSGVFAAGCKLVDIFLEP